MSPKRVGRLAVLSVALVLLSPVAVSAHSPTAGSSRLYTNDNQTLNWDFAAAYPAWLTTAVKESLDTNYDDPATNNSRSPHFVFAAGGAGDVFYSGMGTSPCGTGNPDWLQCANGGGTTTWNIYVRNFVAAPHAGNWTWWDITSSCPSGSLCWYVRRAVIHESLHVTLGVGGHDEQGETNTVMGATAPWWANSGWNTTKLRRCDEAAAQLAYDLRTWDGPYGDCFDHVTGHGTSGLLTNLTVTGTGFHECNGYAISVTGRLEVTDLAGYGRLGGNPLSGRTVWFDRSGVLKYTSAVAGGSAGDNWSRSLTGSANTSYTYTAHFDDASGDGLDDSNKPTFTASWSNAC